VLILEKRGSYNAVVDNTKNVFHSVKNDDSCVVFANTH
jgi:hypothetical protein